MSFPSDLFPEVLCRLQTKTLLKFKVVSKLWSSIIEDHKFSTMHANRLSDSSSTTQICLRNHTHRGVYEIQLNGGVDGVIEEFSTLPEEVLFKHIVLVGSSNGLLCLVSGVVIRDMEDLIIWNPLSSKYHCLPPLPQLTIPLSKYNHYFYKYGFGYDKVNDDYKVLCLQRGFRVVDKQIDFYGRVMVYSRKLKTWRTIDIDIDKFPMPSSQGPHRAAVLFHGSLHWICDKDNSLIAFDLSTEQFKTISQPLVGLCDVGILRDGRLYLLARNHNLVFRILSLNYECCTELSFDVSNRHWYWFMEPIAYVKSPREGVIIYEPNVRINKLVFYDVEKQSLIDLEVTNMKSHDDIFHRQVFPYLKTLELY